MKSSSEALEADLDYAERMVRKGFGTPEQAAQVCGVKLTALKERLAQAPKEGLGPVYGFSGAR